MSTNARRVFFGILAALGVLLVVLQVLLNVLPRFRLPISPWSMLASAAIGFWGFHGLDPRNADGAADTLARIGVKFITAVRTGRRSTDVAVVAVDKVPAVPAPDPADRPTREDAP